MVAIMGRGRTLRAARDALIRPAFARPPRPLPPHVNRVTACTRPGSFLATPLLPAGTRLFPALIWAPGQRVPTFNVELVTIPARLGAKLG